MKQRLLLFAKRPRPGKVKTRLVPPLDATQALSLYRAFLVDQMRFLRELRTTSREVELCLDAPWQPEADLHGALDGIQLSEQGSGDLGERLLRAFERCRQDEVEATVVVGVDSPTLPGRLVDDAFYRLERGADVVLSPARDGGYVLIGMREPRAELFREVAWGGPEVCAVSRARAAGAGLRLVQLDPWYDVDDGRGLNELREELNDPGAAARAPATARCLADLFPLS